MPTLFFADLVRELCQEGGAGALTPTGAVPGHRRFADAVPAGASFHYAIAGIAHPDQWEVGTGRLDDAGRLVREHVATSSIGSDAVDFAPGLKTLALTVGAEWFAANDAAVAARQPLSMLHSEVSTGVAEDALTVQRGTGWVNIPLSTLPFCDAAGVHRFEGAISARPGTAAAPSISFAGDHNSGLFWPTSQAIGMAAGGAEVFRIAQGGFVTLSGVNGQENGFKFTKASGPAGGTVDWTISHRDNDKDLMIYGFNGSEFRGFLYLDWDASEMWCGAALRPGFDNSLPLGRAFARWSAIYAGTGTINTSDAREKQWRGGLSPAELVAARRIGGELGFFQWRDAIAEKGAVGARLHFGVRAQAVWTIMADAGLIDPLDAAAAPSSRYAFLCYDRDQADGEIVDRFGIRPDQLTLFLLAALEARLAAVEAAE